MHNIFNHLLASLCIGDLLFLICNLLLVPIALGVDNIVTKFLYPVAECGYVQNVTDLIQKSYILKLFYIKESTFIFN